MWIILCFYLCNHILQIDICRVYSFIHTKIGPHFIPNEIPFSNWPNINGNVVIDDVSSVQPMRDGNSENNKVVRRPSPSTIATASDAPSGMAHL